MMLSCYHRGIGWYAYLQIMTLAKLIASSYATYFWQKKYETPVFLAKINIHKMDEVS